MHHAAKGFFPGSGAARDVGEGPGKYHTLNLPLRAGASDGDFLSVFKEVHGGRRTFELVPIDC